MRLHARPYSTEDHHPLCPAVSRPAATRPAVPRGAVSHRTESHGTDLHGTDLHGAVRRKGARRLAVLRLTLLAGILLAVPLSAGFAPAALASATRWADGQAWAAGMKLEDYEAGPYEIGGDFTLTNQFGRKTSLKDFRGRVVLVFFGYTHCPDVCPLTLTEMGRLRTLLGADDSRVQAIFITVDPARDTPRRLKSYLTNFDRGIVGLSGPESEIRAIAARYQARFARSETKSASGYLIDHTGFVYMLDGNGKVRYLFTYDVGADLLAQGVRRLLKG